MLKIGLLGFGTVNSGVYEGITDTLPYLESILGTRITVEKILIRDKKRYLGEKNSELFTDSPDDFFSYEFDVVFEAMGGEQPALDYITFLLSKKVPIVTANKELVAKHGSNLENLAYKNETFIGYEATVAGGIPIINTLKSQLQWTSVEKISGILNGTTNYIITRLQAGSDDFETVLKEAQQLGFAEADPTSDIEGFDALYKLQILCRLCFGSWPKPEQFQRSGMSHLKSCHFKAGEYFNLKLKYIAEAYYDGTDIKGSISPCFVDAKSPLASIENENNGVYLQGDWLGNFFASGPGAGKRPTATSMIEDFLHQLQKSGNQPRVPKLKKISKLECKEFLLVFDTNNETEVYHTLKEIIHSVEEVVQFDNNQKVAMLVTINELIPLNNTANEKVEFYPVLRVNGKVQKTKANKQLKAL
ncbi:homoserine dehydrogenase [Anaerobacillus sp. CMMVII]|uniref:homoserine dehydrogenase n=1 Tax=Anaerobacillus sp. CMMVII TaxID=2755588 RepID=UPI0021B75FF3|nr:homoserine dehydrogenase [Anaerobacillus sp. CMMVII]MCT8139550.1 homoserine dehydrogenase [Anaerobacillus sp. CMMVII]